MVQMEITKFLGHFIIERKKENDADTTFSCSHCIYYHCNRKSLNIGTFLYIVYCILNIVYCILYIAYCILYIVYLILYLMYCKSYIVYFIFYI